MERIRTVACQTLQSVVNIWSVFVSFFFFAKRVSRRPVDGAAATCSIPFFFVSFCFILRDSRSTVSSAAIHHGISGGWAGEGSERGGAKCMSRFTAPYYRVFGLGWDFLCRPSTIDWDGRLFYDWSRLCRVFSLSSAQCSRYTRRSTPSSVSELIFSPSRAALSSAAIADSALISLIPLRVSPDRVSRPLFFCVSAVFVFISRLNFSLVFLLATLRGPCTAARTSIYRARCFNAFCLSLPSILGSSTVVVAAGRLCDRPALNASSRFSFSSTDLMPKGVYWVLPIFCFSLVLGSGFLFVARKFGWK